MQRQMCWLRSLKGLGAASLTFEAAEPSRPADVTHLEIPRAGKWRGRSFFCIDTCTHAVGCLAVYCTGLATYSPPRKEFLPDGSQRVVLDSSESVIFKQASTKQCSA